MVKIRIQPRRTCRGAPKTRATTRTSVPPFRLGQEEETFWAPAYAWCMANDCKALGKFFLKHKERAWWFDDKRDRNWHGTLRTEYLKMMGSGAFSRGAWAKGGLGGWWCPLVPHRPTHNKLLALTRIVSWDHVAFCATEVYCALPQTSNQ